MQPLVSVIIPVYNVKPYLCESIDSVIRQTYRNTEIIIVDDGSTDGSSEICDAYQKKDKRIKVIHQKNRGLSAARNAGLDAANGEYIAFLDSDDAFCRNMIEVMIKSITENHADIAACSVYICFSDRRMKVSQSRSRVNYKSNIRSAQTVLELMAERKFKFYVWNKIYSRCLFDQLRFPEGRVYEDIIFMPQMMSRAKRVVQIDLPLIMYRKHAGSITASCDESSVLDWLYARKKAEKVFLGNDKIPLFSKRYFLETTFQHLIRKYIMLTAKKNVSSSAKNIIENELRIRAKKRHGYSFKTRALYCLYRFHPELYIPLKSAYRPIKRIVRAVPRCAGAIICPRKGGKQHERKIT
ncbi:MAG: glycosyltransferase [Oscillospiraceae bacterium]|nr:glycosyltransferase [Oscillospiraceae bacterium]